MKPTCEEDVSDNPLTRPALPFSHCICTGLPRDHLFQRTLTHESSIQALFDETWANISPMQQVLLFVFRRRVCSLVIVSSSSKATHIV